MVSVAEKPNTITPAMRISHIGNSIKRKEQEIARLQNEIALLRDNKAKWEARI